MVPLQHPTKSDGSRLNTAARDSCCEDRSGESFALALCNAKAVSDAATTSAMARLYLATRKRWSTRIVIAPRLLIRTGDFASVTGMRPSDEASLLPVSELPARDF